MELLVSVIRVWLVLLAYIPSNRNFVKTLQDLVPLIMIMKLDS